MNNAVSPKTYENLVKNNNWVTAIQAAIDFASANNYDVSLENSNYTISGDLYLKSNVKLFGGTVTFKSISRVILTGSNPCIENVNINSGNYGHPSKGIIELLDTVKAKFKNVNIIGSNSGKALLCKTKATDTFITNCTVTGLGWGILFNDAESEQGVGYRTVNGVSFNGGSIGSGLYIDNFIFGDGSGTFAGDGIEINAPDNGFSKIIISNSVVNKTNKTYANGIGFGFANCSDVTLSNCKAYSCALDGIHFEKGANHTISKCYVESSFRAYSISSTKNSKLIHCTAVNNNYWFASYNTTGVASDLRLEGNTFDGCSEYGVLVSNAKNVVIKDNIFRNYGGVLHTSVLQFYDSGKGSVYQSRIENNFFIKDSSSVSPTRIISLLNASANNIVEQNQYDGYESTLVKIDTSQNKYNTV